MTHGARIGIRRFFSLVLPAYNPGDQVPATLRELDAFRGQSIDRWEVVFVCDGCTDGTADRLRAWRPRDPDVRVLSYRPNRGKGYAVRQGLLAARAPYRIFTDIDLAYSPDDIRRVADRLLAGDPVAIASRTHPESRLSLPAALQGYVWRRYVQSRLFARLVRLVLPFRPADSQAGLKGMTAHVVEQVVARLRCDGFGLDCELLTACARLGIPVVEVPVHVHYNRAASTTDYRAVVHMVRELMQIRKAWPVTVAPLSPAPLMYREAV